VVIEQRMMRWTGYAASIGEIREAHTILVQKKNLRQEIISET
jgi:hypothetical protein